jgi:CheY-like chemotaxis protein
MGLSPDLLPRIFDLFTQGKQGIERQLGGLGVGLAVARRLVVEHGGEISAASEGPGRGSRFTVRLPRAEEAQPAPSVAAPRASRSGERKRILIVDDNLDSSEMMCALLEEFGHVLRVAADGPSALDAAREFHPDLVFLDIGLPGLNGFEVARRMREIPESATIPIFAVSGYAREADRQRALESGFSDLFAKPVDPERIRKAAEALNATE